MGPASRSVSQTRGPHTRFFSFVDTVSARNFAGTNDANGWVGLRFQMQPGGPPNDVLVHINMRDPSNVLQQEAIGILGVNLIYAAFYELQTEESFLAGLAQDVVGSESRSTTWIFVVRRSRIGIAELYWPN